MGLFGKKAKLSEICRQVVTLAEDGVVAINDAHEIVIFNQGAEKIFGYAEKEVLGRNLDLLLPERFHVHHGRMIEEFGSGEVAARHMGDRARQIYGRRRDGSEFIASVEILRIGGKDLANRHFAAIIRDVSHNRKTEEDLLRLAATDPLTGAFNRREFTAIAERESLRSARYGHPLTLLMLDLDHFKELNDTYGHAAGDKALQRFTAICSNALRNVDVFGRWGGEEFVALLPETDLAGAQIIAERLRRQTAENVLLHKDQKVTFTVSVGITVFRPGETSVDPPMNRADSAVYEAKKLGRNKVFIYRNQDGA